MSNLPPIDENCHPLEVGCKFSKNVLVHVKGFKSIMNARYSHELEEWQIDGLGGWGWVVLEWWELPEIGTGNKV